LDYNLRFVDTTVQRHRTPNRHENQHVEESYKEIREVYGKKTD